MTPPRPNLSRRRFLQSAGLAAALPALVRAQTAPVAAKPAGTARNLIFMVADGMCHGTLAATNHWLNLTADRDTHWTQLYRDGVAHRSLMETRSQSSVVTDSAAASSSWGGGKRIPNHRINIDVDGQAVTPLYTFAREAGKRLGLVTTATVTHATPAGFAANQFNRGDQHLIAEQYLERGVDLLFGGGREFFDAAKRADGIDLYGRYREAGYTVLQDRPELLRAPTRGRLLGTFSRGHIPFAIDRENDAALRQATPSLEEMMEAALLRLQTAPEGFLLQVEAGRVDHAAHNNDPAAIIREMLEFDRCVAIARVFADAHPDTLVVVTTDHGTGGYMLNGEGKDYNESTERFLRLGGVKASLEAWAQHTPPAERTLATLRATLALPNESFYCEALDRALTDWNGDPKDLGGRLRTCLAQWFAVCWTTQNHTGELVEFASFGPGSDRFPGFFENWEVHQILREVLAI